MAWFRCIGSSGGGSTPTKLPYNPDDSDYCISDETLSAFKTSIDAYNEANNITAIDWSTANVIACIVSTGMWDDYSTYTNLKQTIFYIYQNNSVSTSFSSGKNFGNFEIGDSGSTITINDGTYQTYVVYKRRMAAGNRYAGWNVEYTSYGSVYKTYFGDRTLVSVESSGEEGNFSYIPNYPIWISKSFTTTDGQGQTGNFLYKAPVAPQYDEDAFYQKGVWLYPEDMTMTISDGAVDTDGSLLFSPTTNIGGISTDDIIDEGSYRYVFFVENVSSTTLQVQYGASTPGYDVNDIIGRGTGRQTYAGATLGVGKRSVYAYDINHSGGNSGVFIGMYPTGNNWKITKILRIPL